MNNRLSPVAAATAWLGALPARAAASRQRRSEVAALPRVGGLASIPSRAADLARVLERIVPQVERLHLFLHGYEAIPAEARHARIIPVLAPRAHPYRASGKFHGLTQEAAPCLYVCFDDDILYPADYVARIARALIRHEGNAVVGFHGFRHLPPFESYIRDRRPYYFGRRLFFETEVDEIGAGTMGFVSSRLPLDPPSWKYGDVDDLNVAIIAEQLGLRRLALPRPRRHIRGIRRVQAESLWQTVLADETRSVEMMRVLARVMGRLPAEPDDETQPRPASA